MYNPVIERTETEELTFLPGFVMGKLRLFMQKHNIEYEIIHQDDFEEGWPGGYTYGRLHRTQGVVAVKAKVAEPCLHRIAEELKDVDDDEI